MHLVLLLSYHKPSLLLGLLQKPGLLSMHTHDSRRVAQKLHGAFGQMQDHSPRVRSRWSGSDGWRGQHPKTPTPCLGVALRAECWRLLAPMKFSF